MKNNLRKLVSVWLLELVLKLLPSGSFKNSFALFLHQNIMDL